MVTRTTFIGNETGLHARPASRLTRLAGDFKSDIKIKYKDIEIDAKSIINILSNALPGKAEIMVTASGKDENDAVESIVNMLESDLGE